MEVVRNGQQRSASPSPQDPADKTASDGGNGAGAQAEVRLSGTQRAVEFFGLKRSIVGLLSMVILVGMGEHMAERFLPLYLTGPGRRASCRSGFLNGLDNLLSALYSFPGGYLSDRLGTKRALLVFNLLAMVGFVIVILIPNWWAVFIGAVFFLSWTAISLPATMGLVARVLPKNKRTMGVSVHSLVRRVPMALGPIVGGALIYHFRRHYTRCTGRRWAVRWACGGRAGGVRAGARPGGGGGDRPADPDRGRPAEEAGEANNVAEKNPLRLWRQMNPALRNLLVSDILIRFCEQIPYAFVVIWAVGDGHAARRRSTTVEFGVLPTIEMVTAILIYIPVAYLADRVSKKPFVVITFVFFTLFPLVLLLQPHVLDAGCSRSSSAA